MRTCVKAKQWAVGTKSHKVSLTSLLTGDRNPAAVMEEMKADAEEVEARKRANVTQQAKERGVLAAAQQAAQ